MTEKIVLTTKFVKGEDIIDACTYGKYVEVRVGDSGSNDYYIIPMATILKMLKDYDFIGTKKAEYFHLDNPIKKENK